MLAVLFAVQPASGQKVLPKSIQFRGDPEYTNDELMAASGIKLGAVMTIDDMNNVAKKLMATGMFDQLSYKFDGLDLTFIMTPASELFPVRIDNLPINPGPALDAELHSHFPLYHGKVPSEGALLDDVREEFDSMLAAEGLHVNVSAVPYGEGKVHNKVTAMNFTIASPPIRIGSVQFRGASPSILPRLQVIADSLQDGPFSSESTANRLAEEIHSLYRDLGYAAVKIHVAQSGNAVQSEDAIRVPQLVTIEEGKVYRIAAVQMPADSLISQKEAQTIIAAQNDQFPGENLSQLLMRIDDAYKSKGYLDLAVTPHPEFNDAASTVTYTLEIVPGAVYRVGYVKFEDVSDDLRSHLMRAWQLMPGEPMNISYLDTFVMLAQKQDPYLRRALSGVIARYDMSADPVSHQVDLEIHLEDALHRKSP